MANKYKYTVKQTGSNSGRIINHEERFDNIISAFNKIQFLVRDDYEDDYRIYADMEAEEIEWFKALGLFESSSAPSVTRGTITVSRIV